MELPSCTPGARRSCGADPSPCRIVGSCRGPNGVPPADAERAVAKSKSGEFYTFDEVLRQLNIDENRLKRLVSEGEIRAFREGDAMKFKRAEIDGIAGHSRGGETTDTSLNEIKLEEESAPTVGGGSVTAETLTDDLLEEPDLTQRGGMKTAEI